MYILAVGEPYGGVIHRWPEAAEYSYTRGHHELRLFYRNPRAREVLQIRTGVAQFAFVEQEGVIFFLYRFGTMSWSDATFSIHLVPAEARLLPEPIVDPETRALFYITLIDADTGMVRVIRALTVSPEFTRSLESTIRAQAAAPWPGMEIHAAKIRAVHERYPTSSSMLDDAVARTTGGM